MIVESLSFETLFSICIGQIRRYGRADLLIANKLLQSFKTLSHFDGKEKRYKRLLNEEAVSVIEGIKGSSSNNNDLGFIHARILEMNKSPEDYFKLPPSLEEA